MKEDEDYLQLDLTSQEQEIENTDYSGSKEDLKEELEENLTLAIEELEPVGGKLKHIHAVVVEVGV